MQDVVMVILVKLVATLKVDSQNMCKKIKSQIFMYIEKTTKSAS